MAAGGTAFGILPLFLITGQAVLVRRDVPFRDSDLGLAVGSFFLASALASLPSGSFSSRLGPGTAIRVANSLTLLLIWGLATTTSWLTVLALVILAGAANALSQVSANQLLASGIEPREQSFAFGVKQAAVPIAALASGLSLALIAGTVGWRLSFVVAGTAAMAALLLVRTKAWDIGKLRPPDRPPRTRPVGIIVLTIAALLASAASTASSAFLVPFAESTGAKPQFAGFLLALGSLAAIAIRLGGGWIASRHGHPLQLVAALLLAGGLGYTILAVADHAALLLVATLLAFGGAWGWPGVLLYAVARSDAALGRAMALVQLGPFVGGAIGPVLFGAVVMSTSYTGAWSIAAVSVAGAAALVLVAQRHVHLGIVSP